MSKTGFARQEVFRMQLTEAEVEMLKRLHKRGGNYWSADVQECEMSYDAGRRAQVSEAESARDRWAAFADTVNGLDSSRDLTAAEIQVLAQMVRWGWSIPVRSLGHSHADALVIARGGSPRYGYDPHTPGPTYLLQCAEAYSDSAASLALSERLQPEAKAA